MLEKHAKNVNGVAKKSKQYENGKVEVILERVNNSRDKVSKEKGRNKVPGDILTSCSKPVVLQDSSTKRDGIDIEVENDGLEELDYVDDVVVDDKLSDFEEDEDAILAVASNGKKSTKWLPGVTESQNEASDKNMNQSSEKPRMSGITETDHLSDQELANLPRVRNLFNQFWAEKMKEIEGRTNTKEGKNSFLKLPSDTTIYAPALNRGSPSANVDKLNHGCQPETMSHGNINHIGSIVSDFVDSVRIEHSSQAANRDLQEKERRKASNSSNEEVFL